MRGISMSRRLLLPVLIASGAWAILVLRFREITFFSSAMLLGALYQGSSARSGPLLVALIVPGVPAALASVFVMLAAKVSSKGKCVLIWLASTVLLTVIFAALPLVFLRVQCAFQPCSWS
jgi:hypothetical protein